jgi:threonine/homoserine/homoserine lactone efflux protein
MKIILLLKAILTGTFIGVIVSFPSGPAGIESIRWTITKSFKEGIQVAIGSFFVDMLDIILINFGLLTIVEANKLLEIIFWLLSGALIFIIGYKALKSGSGFDAEKEEKMLNKKWKSNPLIIGFLICFTNPMTHIFWLTLSSTVFRAWRYAGEIPYITFIAFTFIGMLVTLFLVNYLASKGKKLATPKVSEKINIWLSYTILAIGAGLFLYGLYILIRYFK